MLSSIHTQDVPLTEGLGEGTIPTPSDQSRELQDVTSYTHIPFLYSPTDSLTSPESLPEEQPSTSSSGCGKQFYILISQYHSSYTIYLSFVGLSTSTGISLMPKRIENPPPTSGKQLHNNMLTLQYYSYKNICISF